jgi:arylsulfatase A-like enzyme
MIINFQAQYGGGDQPVSALVEAVDLVPTLLDLAGIQTPPWIQGRSLLPVLHGGSDSLRGSALTEMTGWKSLRMRGLRYVAHADGTELLFDLERDPGGYQDVAGWAEYQTSLAQARWELIRRLIERERPLPRTWAY